MRETRRPRKEIFYFVSGHQFHTWTKSFHQSRKTSRRNVITHGNSANLAIYYSNLILLISAWFGSASSAWLFGVRFIWVRPLGKDTKILQLSFQWIETCFLGTQLFLVSPCVLIPKSTRKNWPITLRKSTLAIFFHSWTIYFFIYFFSLRRRTKPEDEIEFEVFVRNLAKASYINFNSITEYPNIESKNYMSLLVNLSMNFNPGKKND